MADARSPNRRDLELELERIAKKLGGGWRIEHGLMPVVVLTLREAQALERRLNARP
jgi:hypothetical protein